MKRRRRTPRAVRLLLLFLCVLAPEIRPAATARAEDSGWTAVNDSAYVAGLLAEADRLRLHDDHYWHVLLHYKRGLFGRRSLVDDPRFFADPKGKDDPRAELRATLRAFFTPVTEGEVHPVCRFSARFEWLKTTLRIDEGRLPLPRCEAFEQLLAQIQPEAATISFPTSHMNSPASMYGHTLLTIETATKSKLLAHAVNYSALTPGRTFAPLYVIRGLMGGYPGYFSILPYYAKLQEYSDVNDRDIWEYPLNLDGPELRRLLLHLHELDGIYSNYYFFGENCSYGLLFLLEAARPSLRLTDQFGPWVIPLDTIRAMKRSGLVTGASYRPSKSTKVEYLAAQLPSSGRKKARQLAEGKAEPAELDASDHLPGERATILDLAGEYLQYRYTKGEVSKEEYVPRFLRTLQARSVLGNEGGGRDSIPAPGRPDEGHRSNRLSLGWGVREEDPFLELRWRPAYHGLMDAQSGYRSGSQIVFFDPALRYSPRRREVSLDRVDLIEIVSIARRSAFFHHTSWRVRTGFDRAHPEIPRDRLVWTLAPGVGWARETRALGLSYLFLDGEARLGRALHRGFRAGLGLSTGTMLEPLPGWKVHLSAQYLNHGWGDVHRPIRLGVEQNLVLFANGSLGAAVTRETVHGATAVESRIYANLYY